MLSIIAAITVPMTFFALQIMVITPTPDPTNDEQTKTSLTAEALQTRIKAATHSSRDQVRENTRLTAAPKPYAVDVKDSLDALASFGEAKPVLLDAIAEQRAAEAAEAAEAAAAREEAAAEQAVSTPAPATSSGGSGASAGSLPPLLLIIRSHESGGNYQAYNPTGCEGYGCGGAYQLHARYASTWAARAGYPGLSGQAQTWPAATQDAVALHLFYSTNPDGAHWCNWTDYC